MKFILLASKEKLINYLYIFEDCLMKEFFQKEISYERIFPEAFSGGFIF